MKGLKGLGSRLMHRRTLSDDGDGVSVDGDTYDDGGVGAPLAGVSYESVAAPLPPPGGGGGGRPWLPRRLGRDASYATTTSAGGSSDVVAVGYDPDSADLYMNDLPLGTALRGLDAVRARLAALTDSATAHKAAVEAAAIAERSLGDLLSSAVLRGPPDRAGSGGGSGGVVVAPPPAIRGYLPKVRVDAVGAVGHALAAEGVAAHAAAASSVAPLVGLLSAFEERYGRKVAPLRRRYATQKGDWLRFVRQAEAAGLVEGPDDGGGGKEAGKRRKLEALAGAAAPVWKRTSAELKAEASALAELTAWNLSQWALGVADGRGVAVAGGARLWGGVGGCVTAAKAAKLRGGGLGGDRENVPPS